MASSAADTVTINVMQQMQGVSYATDVHPIWAARNCTACHGAAGGLDLSGNAAATFAAVTAGRVDVGNPPASLILTEPLAAGAGGTAHGGGDFFLDTMDADYQTILSWIMAGAPNN
jgi:hypothetical protein